MPSILCSNARPPVAHWLCIWPGPRFEPWLDLNVFFRHDDILLWKCFTTMVYHHCEMSSYHDCMVLPIFCQWTDSWVDFLIDMVANSLLKLSVPFQGSPTQATTAQRGLWSLRRREDSTPTSSKGRREKGEARGDRPSPGLAGKHIHPGRPFHENCLKHWVKFPEFAYA